MWKLFSSRAHLPSMPKQQIAIYRERFLLFWYSMERSYYYSANLLGTSPGRAHYWTKKFLNPAWHAGAHGGLRRSTFKPEELELVSLALLRLLKERPLLSLKDLVNEISRIFQRCVTRQVLQRILKQMRWSWRIPAYVQINKFKITNLEQ